jgi:hypothetical protein
MPPALFALGYFSGSVSSVSVSQFSDVHFINKTKNSLTQQNVV